MADSRISRLKIPLIAAAALLCALALTRTLWLPVFGYALIRDDGRAKAGIAVILGGDYYGHRILKAGELVRQGYAPVALISGPPGFYGVHECDMALPFALRHGFPPESFIAFPHAALSTKEEAVVVVAELRRRGLHSALIVTSDYHTARAGRIFEAAVNRTGGGIAIHMVPCPDEFFRAADWWRNREAQKVVFMEWTKTLTALVGI